MKLEGFVDWDGDFWVKKVEITSPTTLTGTTPKIVKRYKILPNNMNKLHSIARHKLWEK